MGNSEISRQALDQAHSYIMDDWVWMFGYETWTRAALAETIFWFAASGQAISREKTTEGWVGRIRKRQSVPKPARDRWRGSHEVAALLGQRGGSIAFGWFTDHHPKEAWAALQEIKYVGPKIAAWILRDLSLLRDYSRDLGSRRVEYRHRDASGFRQFPVDEQAVFLPLDRWVIRSAKRLKIIPRSFRMAVLQDSGRYCDTARRIASWARERHLDCRDLDVYLYLRGTQLLREDGTTEVKRRDRVWWT
jgi:hypothetical protein